MENLSFAKRLRAFSGPQSFDELRYGIEHQANTIIPLPNLKNPSSLEDLKEGIHRQNIVSRTKLANSSILGKSGSTPLLGFFWFDFDDENKLGFTLLPFDIRQDGLTWGDFIVPPGDHSIIWPAVQEQVERWHPYKCIEVPSGRVLYRISTQEFVILVDQRFVHDKEVITRIKNEFNLPKKTVVEPYHNNRPNPKLLRK